MINHTEWFPPEQKPVREGLYLIKYARGSDCWHIAYWHKGTWYSAGVGCRRKARHRRVSTRESLLVARAGQ